MCTQGTQPAAPVDSRYVPDGHRPVEAVSAAALNAGEKRAYSRASSRRLAHSLRPPGSHARTTSGTAAASVFSALERWYAEGVGVTDGVLDGEGLMEGLEENESLALELREAGVGSTLLTTTATPVFTTLRSVVQVTYA